MNDLRQAALAALEALQKRYVGALRDRAIEALEQALAEHDRLDGIEAIEKNAGIHVSQQAEPEQKPVAWRLYKDGELYALKFEAEDRGSRYTWEPLYTAAPTPRKPLTDEEIQRVCAPLGAAMLSFIEVARAIERKHGIGEQT